MLRLPAVLLMFCLATATASVEAAPSLPQQHTAPAVSAIDLSKPPPRIDQELPDNNRLAEKAADIHINYTPGEEKIWYFDSTDHAAAAPVPDGYYRKQLGTTADGRPVIQIFDQETCRKMTSPAMLTREAVLSGFEHGNPDSKIVFYHPDGSIYRISEYGDGGKRIGRSNGYKDGVIIVQSEPPEDARETDDPYAALGILSRGIRAYDDNGKLQYIYAHDKKSAVFVAWREDGSPHYALEYDAKDVLRHTYAWDEAGKPIDPASVSAAREASKARLRIVNEYYTAY